MAVPRSRNSHARSNKRRSHNALKPIQFARCPNCKNEHEQHHICVSCGFYNGRQVLVVG